MKTIPRSISEIDWSTWKAKDPATLVLVVTGGRILLIRKKRGLGAGKINAPGGRQEPRESALECAIREVQEELHITPKNVLRVGVNRFQFVDGYSIHVQIFLADGYEGFPTETDEAVPLWFHLDEIPYSEMWEDDRLWVPLALKRQYFDGRYIFDDDKMVDYVLDEVTELPS